MKKKKPFVRPELREEASLEEVTLQGSGICATLDPDLNPDAWNDNNCSTGGGT